MKKPFLRFLLVYTIFLVSSVHAQVHWFQLSGDINGVAPEDEFGLSVSMNAWGNIVAVGAPYNDDAGSDAGHVRVFEWVNSSWIKKGATLTGAASVNFFGNSVSLSADGLTLAVGAPFNSGNGASSGQVRVFEFNGSDWIQKGSVLNGKAPGNQAGFCVSLSSNGTTVAIGSPYKEGEIMEAGLVTVYEFSGNSWVQKGDDLVADSDGDLFGFSLDINDDGSVLVVGAPNKAANGQDAGQVKVFLFNQGNWELKGSSINGFAAGDFFGYTVSLSDEGERFVAGAPGNDGNGLNAGHVRVFQFESGEWLDSWSAIEGEAEGDRFGSAVSMSNDGSTVAAGAIFHLNVNNNIRAGQIRVFEYSDDSWQQRLDNIYGKAASDQFGYSVSLSQEGWHVCGGARLSDGGGNNSGSARVFGNSMVGIKELSKENLKIQMYPNPNKGVFMLESNKNGNYSVINNLGQTVQQIFLLANTSHSIDISHLDNGVYFIVGRNENQFTQQKIMLIK
jgi:hypothetical protein